MSNIVDLHDGNCAESYNAPDQRVCFDFKTRNLPLCFCIKLLDLEGSDDGINWRKIDDFDWKGECLIDLVATLVVPLILWDIRVNRHKMES